MSFSTRVKDDLARIRSEKDCCRKAEFCAFFLINGNIRIAGLHRLSVFMQTEHSGCIRKMFTFARELGLARELSIHRRTRLNKNNVYTITVPHQEKLSEFLRSLAILDEDGCWQMGFPKGLRENILSESCCRRAYLRGAFEACGAISEPEGSSYHLEFSSLEQEHAELLVDLLAEHDLKGKIVHRKESSIVYLKGAEEISQLLIIMGSHRSLLEFESVRVAKEVRNQVNRQRNCDTANIEKAISAGMRQVEDINYIAAAMDWQKLPESLRQAAELRLDYPEYSLTDLSEVSSLGRSALNHRLRRLSQIAQNIRDFGPEQWNRQE